MHAKSLQSSLTFATLWTVVCQAPLFMGFSRQEYWSGLPFPSPEDLPNLLHCKQILYRMSYRSVSSPPSPCLSSSPTSVSVFLSFRRPVLESKCIRRRFALKVWLEVRFFWHKLSLICLVSWRMMTALANYDVSLKPHKWQTWLSESRLGAHTGAPLYAGLCFLALCRYCFFNKLKACGYPALWDNA